jgi:hypothetical protein
MVRAGVKDESCVFTAPLACVITGAVTGATAAQPEIGNCYRHLLGNWPKVVQI